MVKELRVLIVEDSPDDVSRIIDKLRSGGYDVYYERVETKEALESALQNKQWDVIISDFRISCFNALDALSVLHQQELAIPFIIVSSSIDAETAVNVMKKGANDYIVKDDLARLVAVVEHELQETEVRKPQRHAQRKLSMNDAFTSELLTNAPNPIIVINSDTSIKYVNPALERLTGYSSAELVGKKTPYPWWIAERHKQTNALFKKGLEGSTKGAEQLFQKKTGETFWVQLTMAPVMTKDKVHYYISNWVDITERKQSEATLQKSEASLAEAQRMAKLGNWEWDIVNDIAWWSDEMYRIFGLEPQKFEPVLENSLDLMHPEDREFVKQAVEDAIRENKHYSIEYRIILPDGCERNVHGQGTVLYDKTGKAEKMVGTVQDITERKKIEEEIQLLVEEWKTTFDSIDDLVSVHDKDFRFVRVNKAFAEQFTLNPEDFVGKRCYEVIHRTDKPWATCPHKQALDLKKPVTEEFYEPNMGIYLEVSASPIFDKKGECIGTVHITKDVTSRKRAQEKLKESEQRYRLVAENASDVIFIQDMDLNITYVSPSVTKLSGYTVEEILNMKIQDLMTPDSFAKGLESFQKSAALAKDKKDVDVPLMEYEYVRKDGSTLWGELRATFLRDAKGRPVSILGVLRDITGRKNAEKALRESEERLKLIVDTAYDGINICEFDPKTTKRKLLFCNDRYVEMSGYTREELFDSENLNGLVILRHSEEELMHQYTCILKGIRYTGLASWKRPDGKENYYEWTAVPVTVDGKIHIIGVDRDVTERRKMEAALLASEAKYRKVVENVPYIMCTVAPDGTTTFVNSAIETIAGYTPEMVIGKNWMKLFYPGKYYEQVEELFKHFENRGQVEGYEMTFVDSQGKEKILSWTSANSYNEKGALLEIMGIGIDITEKKRLEDQLRQSQKMEAVGTLAGGVAHDFNNLLTGITGYLQLIEGELDAHSQAKQDIKEVIDLSERAATLTRRLLAFSRQQAVQLVTLDINNTIDELAKLIHRLIGEHISLELHLASDIWNIKADKNQMEQVILNLVVNARDAMLRGGRMSITTSNVVVDETMARHNADLLLEEYVLISITDTGSGMDEETLRRATEPFFTTKEVGKGTGLGLSTVYGIVKKHEGTMVIDSVPDKGTTVRIYLPRIVEQIDAQKQSDRASNLKKASTLDTILVVEDEPAVLQIIERILSEQGYRVVTTTNPERAMEIFNNVPDEIGLLITDIVMPGQSGQELHRSLLKVKPDLKVLYISGYAPSIIADRGLMEIGTPFLQKPFTTFELLAKVAEVLE